MACAISEHLEGFLEYNNINILGWDKTIKVKMLIDVTKPHKWKESDSERKGGVGRSQI